MTVTFDDVLKAAKRIEGRVHRTPIFTSERLNEIAGAELFFKSENLQKSGSFKARGAVNAAFSLTYEQAKKGVATHSSGNHGAALARAAELRGIPAYIVVPENAKAVKKAAIESYGGKVIECTATLQAREDTLAEVVDETGAFFVHPYDQTEIIAGQGTAALELTEQVDDLDVIITPIGGGGLLAGSTLVAEQRSIDIYGAEPAGADDAYRSFKSGERVTEHVPDTICDGLLTTVGERNFDVIRHKVRDILLATDEETVEAMKLIWSRMKVVVEPSSAVMLAALLNKRRLFKGRRVGLVLTGGNVDLEDLPF